MVVDIEELRREKERLEREREEVERRLAAAERRQKEEQALQALASLREYTRRIDELKHERQQTLERMRELAPRLGDFTYAAEDYRTSLPAARAALKQPELLDKILAALDAADIHVEPRAPRFRLFKKLYAVGTLQTSSRRIVLGVTGPVLDPDLLSAIENLDARFPGLAKVQLASTASRRRVKTSISPRRPDGDFAESITFAATDTGSLDAVLPLFVHSLEHVAAWYAEGGPEEQARWFEPIDSPASNGSAATDAMSGGASPSEPAPSHSESSAATPTPSTPSSPSSFPAPAFSGASTATPQAATGESPASTSSTPATESEPPAEPSSSNS